MMSGDNYWESGDSPGMVVRTFKAVMSAPKVLPLLLSCLEFEKEQARAAATSAVVDNLVSGYYVLRHPTRSPICFRR